MYDPMGDRIKEYEKKHTSDVLDPHLPICVRIDGRAFHTFTRGLFKPFDYDLIRLFKHTTEHLIEQTDARFGYHQSDEITLVLHTPDENSQALFGGKVFKLCSVLASLATGYFVRHMGCLAWPPGVHTMPIPSFDCRVFNVPDEAEAANVVLWRWFDARRNSISAYARSNFSHKELHKKSTNDMLAMLADAGHNWNDLPSNAKWGTFLQWKTVTRWMTTTELLEIPEEHWPKGPVRRSYIVPRVLNRPFCEMENRVGFVLRGEDPEFKAL